MRTHRRIVSSAVRVYGSALLACPRTVRERFGDDMRRTFEDRCESEASRGALAIVALLLRELFDLAATSFVSRVGADPRVRPGADTWVGPYVDAGGSIRRRRSAISDGIHANHRRRNPVRSLSQDIRYAFRMLYRQPVFTAVAVLTLALGIGATTAVFTVVNGVLLRPLPYRDPDAIVQLLHSRNGRTSMSYSPPNYRDVTTQSGVFSESAAISPATGSVTGTGDPQQIEGAYVTTRFFNVLGVTPRYGRGFVEADGADGSDSVVVLSDALWRRLFGARPDVVGSTMRMDGGTFTIIGVAPPEVSIPAGAEYWRPLVFTPDNLSERQRGAQWVGAIARLQPGVGLERAQSAMATVAERLSRDYPRTNQGRTMSATRLQDRIVRGIRPALLILLGAVTLVLLVACVNVANLLLARANSRTREVAVRAAVGAGRGRLVQQFLAESIVLGLAGGLAGLVVAFWSTRALIALGPASIPRLAEVGIDICRRRRCARGRGARGELPSRAPRGARRSDDGASYRLTRWPAAFCELE